MITLFDVATKLENILNGVDTEYTATRPNDFLYEVQTAGFHIDHSYNNQVGKNFIPVFIDVLGGEYNPVKNIKEGRQNISVAIYFPVRFKNDLFALKDYLIDAFVGQFRTYGTQKALTNMSVETYGEIVNTDLKKFSEWTTSIYRKAVDVTEPYISMTFTLYLSQAGSDYIYGNEATISLSISDGTNTYTDSDVAFADTSVQSNTEPAVEQLFGAIIPEAQGLGVNTAYSSGFSLYYKKTTLYRYVLEQWFGGKSQELVFTLSLTLDNKTYTRTCYLQSANLNIRKGQLVTFTFAFGKRIA